MTNDIAIIKLEKEIKPTSRIQFACLPFSVSNSYPMPNTKGYIIGWGRISECKLI